MLDVATVMTVIEAQTPSNVRSCKLRIDRPTNLPGGFLKYVYVEWNYSYFCILRFTLPFTINSRVNQSFCG